MSHKNTVFTAVLLTVGALVGTVTGCELLVTVDRSKIPATGVGGGTGGATASATTTTGGGMGTGGVGTGGKGTGGNVCAGAPTCGTPQDCPDPMTECKSRTCSSDGCCGTANVPGMVVTMNGQTAGDCMEQVCDGNGNAVMVNDDADVPADDGNPCTAEICTNGAPSHPPQAGACTLANSPAVCGDPAGAAAGTCVQCNVNADCTSPQVCSAAGNMCVGAACNDGMQDGSETDVDCGGSCGATCAYFPLQQKCQVNGDCVGGDCVAGDGGVGGLCTQPACNDAVRDGNETDVDCGGSGFMGLAACPKCADNANKKCAANGDCAGGFCDQTVSPHLCKTPTCSDGQKNGTETGVDCGGATCDALGNKCGLGIACGGPNDCASGSCTGNVCVQCNAPNDCPATGNECIVNTCNANMCGTSDLGNAHAVANQTPGDCQQRVCDGAGGTISIDDAGDPPVANSVCETMPTCAGTPLAPSFTPAATGTDCTADNNPPNQVCGDVNVPNLAGTCVECNVDADCLAINDAGALTCTNGVCVN